MAKAVKIPLVMKNGEKATDMKSLIDNFDVESVVGYFLDGKLEKWLNDRYYEDEAEAVSQIDKDDSALAEKLCEIFGIEYEDSEVVDTEEIARRNERISRLKQLTDDEDVIKNIDCVAFDQEELADLYDKGIEKIWLCEGDFHIPKSKQEFEYIVIGEAVVENLPQVVHEEPVAPCRPEIIISRELDIGKYQEKHFENSRVIIDNQIICCGTLVFDNCEIVCKITEINISSFPYNVIRLNKGTLIFINCKIDFDSSEYDYRDNSANYTSEKSTMDLMDRIKKANIITNKISRKKYFINCDDSKIDFKCCEFFGCKNMVLVSFESEILFESCKGHRVCTPFLYGFESLCKLYIRNSKFISDDEPNSLKKTGILTREALFSLLSPSVEIQESEFEGFAEGVICWCNDVTIKNSKFVECSSVICGRKSYAKLDNCTFEKCFNLFDSFNSYECCILVARKCNFVDCVGKIKVSELKFDSCEWKNGFMCFCTDGYSVGEFFKCTFENIDRNNFAKKLYDAYNSGYGHVRINSSEIDELLECNSALIDFDSYGEIRECKFSNINVGNNDFVIKVGEHMKIEDCVFNNCVAGQEILNIQKGDRLFDENGHRRATYSIKNCIGIGE